MEGLVIEELPQDLQRLDAQALLCAMVGDTLDLDDLDRVLSQVPNPDEIKLPEQPCETTHSICLEFPFICSAWDLNHCMALQNRARGAL